MTRICFVCLGNICRSPTAEAVMAHLLVQSGLANEVHIDSAGTGAWHAGERPDARATAAAQARGIPMRGRARQFEREDFGRFDYVLAMDQSNYRNLVDLAPDDGARDKVHLFRSFDAASPDGAEVPDPYYGGPDGFETVLDICEAACLGLIEHLKDAP